MKLRIVNRYSPGERLFRLFRLVWGGSYPSVPSRKLTFAVAIRKERWLPGLFRLRNGETFHRRWHLVLIPCVVIRIHYARSYGGRFV
jgi:hypothetical protein